MQPEVDCSEFFFFVDTLEPRVESHKCLLALNASPIQQVPLIERAHGRGSGDAFSSLPHSHTLSSTHTLSLSLAHTPSLSHTHTLSLSQQVPLIERAHGRGSEDEEQEGDEEEERQRVLEHLVNSEILFVFGLESGKTYQF